MSEKKKRGSIRWNENPWMPTFIRIDICSAIILIMKLKWLLQNSCKKICEFRFLEDPCQIDRHILFHLKNLKPDHFPISIFRFQRIFNWNSAAWGLLCFLSHHQRDIFHFAIKLTPDPELYQYGNDVRWPAFQKLQHGPASFQ